MASAINVARDPDSTVVSGVSEVPLAAAPVSVADAAGASGAVLVVETELASGLLSGEVVLVVLDVAAGAGAGGGAAGSLDAAGGAGACVAALVVVGAGSVVIGLAGSGAGDAEAGGGDGAGAGATGGGAEFVVGAGCGAVAGGTSEDACTGITVAMLMIVVVELGAGTAFMPLAIAASKNGT